MPELVQGDLLRSAVTCAMHRVGRYAPVHNAVTSILAGPKGDVKQPYLSRLVSNILEALPGFHDWVATALGALSRLPCVSSTAPSYGWYEQGLWLCLCLCLWLWLLKACLRLCCNEVL
jgi:hypothetical protein